MENAKQVLDNFEQVLAYIAQHKGAYVKHPGKDFCRNRKLPLQELLRAMITMEGGSLNKELVKLFGFEKSEFTKSAFVQQRNKLYPKAFYDILRLFNEKNNYDKKWNGYRLIAVDGSSHNIYTNKKSYAAVYDKHGEYLYTALHLNAAYDVINNVFVDAFVQPEGRKDEPQGLWTFADRQNPAMGKTIYLVDRGYESYNTMAHFIESKHQNLVLRAKNEGLSIVKNRPMAEWDIDICETINNRRTSYAKEENFIPIHVGSTKGKEQSPKTTQQRFDYPLPYTLKIRAVRFKLSTGEYETLFTTLPREEFGIDVLKELYHMRWKIEIAFNNLKHACGSMMFHTKSVDVSTMELLAALVRFNLCEHIVSQVCVANKATNKYTYKIDFKTASTLILDFLRKKKKNISNLCTLIAKYIEPERPGRRDKRKTIVAKPFISFSYRAAA